ncbi:hypothetical protein ACHAXA_010398 [Cyclostephanos tholiformis]|uniref:Uncharacterized protein n=1 Tax=Cyclostephanos tholiformis TaxID=382380 RepID=A0ABD3SF22_9STRA
MSAHKTPGHGNRPIRAALIDVSGTIHVGRDAIPGAISACRRLRSERGVDLRVLYLTNTSRMSSAELLMTLRDAGFDDDALPGLESVMTSVGATRRYLLDNELRPFCLVGDDLLTSDLRDVVETTSTSTMDPNCVLVGLAPEKLDYANVNTAYRLLLKWKEEDDAVAAAAASASGGERRPIPIVPPSPRLIAVHRSTRHRDDDGHLSLGPGAYVSLLEGAVGSGLSARVIGKPSRDFYMAALSCLGEDLDPSEVVMVGDDIVGDVIGALDAGLGRAILVRTGKYVTGDELGRGGVVPTLTVDSIVEAVDYICSNSGLK